MAAGLDRIVQRDFSGGMFESVAPELIPANGLADVRNGLLDQSGAIYKRGGSTYFSATALTSAQPLTFVWDGWLTGGQRTVIANAVDFGIVSGGAVTNLGGAGLARPGRAAVMQGVMYFPGGATYDGTTLGTAGLVSSYYAAVGSRLLAATGDRVDFSNIGAPGTFSATDFHRLPGGVQIKGIEGLRDSAAVFTTGGLWLIRNMNMNLTDATGNVQQALDLYSRDLVLWADAGIASWAGSLIVPALDGVWVVALGSTSEAAQPFQKISDAINARYLEHVRVGRWPGRATVYRNHYLLPILDATGTVEVLVCNLAAVTVGRSGAVHTFPWSRLDGFGARVAAFAVRQEGDVQRLLGAGQTGRVLEGLYFAPSAATAADADASTARFEVSTRDFATGQLNLNTVTKLRATYEMADPDLDPALPKLNAAYESGEPLPGGAQWGLFDWGGASWTAIGAGETLTGRAPADPFADSPFSWPVGRRARYARFRLWSDDPVARLSLRALELFVRAGGRL